MADSQITFLPPQQQIQSPTQIAQGGTSQSNAALTSLPTGTVLQGFIINRDASGNPILRTDKGDIPFASSFFLKIGSEVVLRVTNVAGNTSAQLLSVDGQSPEEAQNASAFSQDPEVILSPNLSQTLSSTTASATPNVPGTPTPATPSITISGTVISQPQVATAQTQALSNGTQLTLKIVSLNSPASAAPVLPESQTVVQTSSTQSTSAFYATYARAAATPATIPSATTASTAPAAITTNTQPENTQATPLPSTTPATSPTVQTSTTVLTQTPATTTTPVNPQAVTLEQPTITNPQIPQATPLQQPAANAAAPVPVATAIITTPALPATSTPTAIPTQSTQTTTPPAQTIQPATTITATVLSTEPSGELIVQSPVGVVRLQAGTPIPTGSQITLQIVQATPPSAQAITAAAIINTQPAPITELAQQWTSIQQIFGLLTGRATPTGLDNTALPVSTQAGLADTAHITSNSANAQSISSAMLTFMSAVRKGDFDNWLGASNIKLLQAQGHDDLIKKAQAEFSTIARQFTESQPGHWQPLFFPLPTEGTTQQARLYVKRDRKQGNTDGQKKSEDTRFVIEVDLTQLGELQMDGFVRTQDKELQFDMVIRSTSGLPKDIQNDISKIYNDMGEVTGYKGSISFQNVKEFPVNPMQDIADSHDTVVV